MPKCVMCHFSSVDLVWECFGNVLTIAQEILLSNHELVSSQRKDGIYNLASSQRKDGIYKLVSSQRKDGDTL